MDIARRHYPENFQDFSEASFGSLMLDAVAYVGDQLSFYLDYSVNESFLDTAYSIKNILRHGKILGYNSPGRPSTYGKVALYVEVPAESSGLGPDSNYIPILNRGTTFQASSGLNFVLTENIDFNSPKNPIIVSKVSDATGAPTHYAIKSYGNVVSGKFGTTRIKVNEYQKFKKIKLPIKNLSEIISVFDDQGNEFFEVQHLSQDLIYREIPNDNYKNDNVPSIMKPLLVSRKFMIIRERSGVFMQFGSGNAAESNVIASPQDLAMDIFGKDYITDTSFDPTKLSKNINYGIVPSDTTLTVFYRTTNPANSNVSAGGVNKVGSVFMEFKDLTNLATSKTKTVEQSIEVTNESPIVGSVSMPGSDEIKRRIFDTFPTQDRAVTQADYENLAYRMPGKFGAIKRVSVQKDPDSIKRNLNMYVISEDKFGKLIKANTVIKNNLKTWINHYRMINDTVDIIDPYIINIGIEFVVKVIRQNDKNLALDAAITALNSVYSQGFFIGEHLEITDIYSILKSVGAILDVLSVRVVNKVGSQYSNVQFSVDKNLSPEGGRLICPRNAIFEIKFSDVDIKGKVR
tara:strand:- start:2043 stop:3764 length:1722 start_codon:yes stop_codon:yes gene_type:complete